MWPFQRNAAPVQREEPTFKNASPENPSTSLSNPSAWLIDSFGGAQSYAGPMVTERSAIRSTTVFRCVSLISGLIAGLPLTVYEREKDGRRVADNHRLYPILHDQPNDLMGSFTWRELISVDLLLGGNHYSWIERDNANRVTGLLPIQRNAAIPYRYKGRTRYLVTLTQLDTGETAREIDIDQSDMLHIPGIGFNGLKGISPIADVGRQSVGLDLAIGETMSRLHSNGVRPSGTVKVDPGVSPEAFKRMRSEFNELYSGSSNAGKTIFLDKGSEFQQLSLSPEDAQTLESRRFQVTDICRLYGVPPHLVCETDSSTSWGTGIEQQSLGFLRFTLEPWLKRIEDEIQRKLFLGTRFYVEFDRDAILAMDAKTRAEMFSSGIQNGYIQPAEARRKMNLPFVPGSDRLLINSTLQPLDQAGKEPPQPGAKP